MRIKFAAALLCAAGIAMPAFAGDVEDVKAVFDTARNAFNSCDVATMQTLTLPENFSFKGDGTLSTGNSMDGMKASCDAGVKFDFHKVTLLKVYVRGEMAVVAGTAKGTVTPKDGESRNVNGKFTNVLVKKGDGWKFLHTHDSGIVTTDSD